MFFAISRIEQANHLNSELANPKNPGNTMLLGIYRQLTRTALFTVYSTKAFGEYWDYSTQKKIPRRLWTAEMRFFAQQKAAEAPRPPFIFKLTIVGWIFVLLMMATMVLIVYESVKPPVPKSSEYLAMEKAPEAGDIYFGRYESFKNSDERVASDLGFGWFKVVKAEGGTYHIAQSKEMSKKHKAKDEMNSTDFEEKSTAVQIVEQAGYMINMKSADGRMEIYITDKK